MWLSVCPSNKDPNVIAHYYTECVENVGGKVFHIVIRLLLIN